MKVSFTKDIISHFTLRQSTQLATMEGKRFEDSVRMLIYVQLFLTSVCGAYYLDVRLVNGSNNVTGRVEVWYNGTWGTVCDDGWDLNDANVVCRMLGFFNASSAPGLAAYGAGSGKIHLDEVECIGSESRLEDCIKSEFGVHNCDHSEDAGVTCGDSPAFQPQIWIPKTRIVDSSPCMTKTDRLGRYTVIGGDGNIWSVGVHSGSRVQVSVRCDAGAMAQQPVTSQCSNGTWIPPWPRCEKPCSVPRNRGQVRQFVNDERMSSYYNRPTLPDGTQVVARCRDPGKYRLIGDQRRTCEGGRWTGEEPICQPVQTQVLFYGASRVASNGTVVVYVYRGNPLHLNVLCRLTSLSLRPPRLTTPLVNDGELPQWHRLYTHKIELSLLSTDFSGMYTCSGSSSSHSVHVLFKESPEPPKNNGSCLNSCCTSSKFSCNPEGCYCDSWCEWNDNCCDDYEDVCPILDRSIDVFTSNTTYNMRGGELIRVSSPNYPNNYNNRENLLWHVKSVHGRQFVMTFSNVRLHSIRDNIRIYTGISDIFEESSQIFHLTYNSTDDLPDHYWSIHPNIWLQFSTDAFGTDRGFSILIMSTSIGGCDGSRFQCTNGQCIHRSAACDGFSECVDSSDEYNCAPRNGSCSDSCCVNSEYSCNPEGCFCDRMCVDNGNCCDDYSDVCPTTGNGTTQHPAQFTTTSLILNTACKVPAAPEHGRLLDGSRQQPRYIFPAGATVSFQCKDYYSLVGSRKITCEKGQWSDDPPVCTG